MGFLRELRSSLENPSTPLSFPAEWLLDIFNGGKTDSGIRVSEMSALQISTVYTCVDLVSSTLARMPLNVYEYLDEDSVRIARDHAVHFLLHDEPNDEMTSFIFLRTILVHALLWSNGFAEIQRNPMGQPVAIWPRWPHQTRPRRASEKFSYQAVSGEYITIFPGELYYATTDGLNAPDPMNATARNERPIHSSDMIHLMGLTLDGRLGRGTVELMRQVFGLSLAAEKFGAKFFANGLRPSGVVELPLDMKAPAIENFKRSLQEAYGGENTHRPMILETGMKWSSASTNPNDAQFLETRNFQKEEICSIFHVPPHKVGATDKSSRASVEQMAIEFKSDAIDPWAVGLAQEFKRKLFPKSGRSANKYYPGFDLEELTYPDAASRAKYFESGKQWGWFNTNDIRKKLKMNPIDGKAGKDYWMPVNMQDASNPITAVAPDAGDGGDASKPDPEADKQARVLAPIFRAAFEQVSKSEKRDFDAFSAAFKPVLIVFADVFRSIGISEMSLRATSMLSGDVVKFVSEYIDGLAKRCGSVDCTDQVIQHELYRASRALRIAVYRDLATQKAKETTSKELSDEAEA